MSKKELNTQKNKKHKSNSFFKISIYQIVLGGMMTGIAILLGTFASFKIGAGGVYLIGISIFLMPLVLKLPILIISTVVSVVITDLMTGYIAYTWISCIAYGAGVLIIWLSMVLIKIKLFYVIGVIIGSCALVSIYYLLSMSIPAFDHARVISDTVATVVEMAIVMPLVCILYLPFRLIPK